MFIVGISAYYHDAAAVLLKDDEIVAAAQEERFTRKKYDPCFPAQALRYCLSEGEISLQDVAAVVFYEKPFLKFERLLESFYQVAPRGLPAFLRGMPIWMKEKLFLKREIRQELSTIDHKASQKMKLLFSEHHLSHAASVFFTSPYKQSAIVTIDGVGEWATATIAHGKGSTITVLKELHFPHSIGLFYSAFTYYLGFKVNAGEYKLMGLAPYGKVDMAQVKHYVTLIREHLVEIKNDGSLLINKEYFDYLAGSKMVVEKKWQQLFKIGKRAPGTHLTTQHACLALAAQMVIEEVEITICTEAKKLTREHCLCLAGGVALNCVANSKLRSSGLFNEVYVQPAAGDAGGALGAAYAAYHIYFQKARELSEDGDKLKYAFLGPAFDSSVAEEKLFSLGAKVHQYDSFDALCEKVAELLDEGEVVGWFQGRMEWGPRALGNRSIIADPRNEQMQRKVNLKVKFRESFRPFAPAVLEAEASDYFSPSFYSPYMLFVTELAPKQRKILPEKERSLSIRERVGVVRSKLPAITHVDFSSRFQTVRKEQNDRFYQLLTAFKKRTGCSVLLNTSFNRNEEPIVCTPEDAYRCFMATEIDVLVIENYLLYKEEQSARSAK